MKAIRGATTVVADEPDEIRKSVKDLLENIARENKISEREMICILFSNTSDIRSLYPAKAAREAGFVLPALYSSAEPEIDGALPRCIRVLVLAETENSVKHIYMRGAANLRKDLKKFAIALDGPSGSGKSTVAKLIANDLDVLYLDTGAMYRACALAALQGEIDLTDEMSIRRLMSQIDLRIEYRCGTQYTLLNGTDVSDKIRKPEISMAASDISAFACVREKMVDMQRQIAADMSCVLDGRDIGSAVLPNAEFKFYITATSEVRAKRRFDELKGKGYSVDFDTIKKEIEERDYNDSHRAISPLRKADDAVTIDTSEMSIKEVLNFIKKKMQENT